MNNLEQELKILLTKKQYDKLLKVSGKMPLAQVNMYFYCQGQPRDTMVRLRLKLGKYTFCYKKLRENRNGVNICDEREQAVDNDTAHTMLVSGITPDKFEELTGIQTNQAYRFVEKLVTWRTAFTYDYKWNLELDKNEYLGVTDYELECECVDLAQLEELKRRLNDDFGIAFVPSKPKSERFAEVFNKKYL